MALDSIFGILRLSAAPAGSEEAKHEAEWRERLVTGVAVSAAVLVVAFIAALMGMVGP